jgi:hypothetical protein
MSIKTLRKRIALVAVSALGAGLISVVAVPSANAAAELTVTTTTGSVVAPSTSASVGTGTIAVTGSVKLAVAAGAASTAFQVRVSGGTFTGVTSGANINADGTIATSNAQTTAIVGLDAKPTAAGRNMVVKLYISGATTGVDTASLDAATTYHSIYTFTVVAAGTAGVASPGDSKVVHVGAGSSGTTIAAGSLTTDLAYANVVGAGGLGLLAYNMYDANGVILNSATTTSTATVKSGACVVGTTATNATITSAYETASVGDWFVYQADATNTPATTCVVEVAANGVVVATKTFVFQGPVKNISVSSIERANISTSAQTGLGYIVIADSAGNVIGNKTITGYTVNATDVAYITAVSVSAVTAMNASGVNSGASGSTSAPSTIGWTCTGAITPAAGIDIQFKSADGNGGYIYSPVYKAHCNGNPVKFTASLDKASYVPGDIATLTITATDKAGGIPNEQFTIGSGSTAELITTTGSQMTRVEAVTVDTLNSTGKKTYKFVVGTTEGSYSMVVDVPLINTATNAATYGAAAQTVAYKVAAATATVSNTEVLAAIVKLIASINKQIRALQKSLRR